MTDEHDHRACRELAERLSEYLDGELPPELAQKVEEHFVGCATCEAFMESLARVRDLGAWLPEERLPEGVAKRIRERGPDS
jgi:anti-sigma factor RsiW